MTDEDGLDEATYSYQWWVGNVEIEGATGATYVPTVADVGKSVEVQVTIVDDLGGSDYAYSAATDPVVAGPPTRPRDLVAVPGDTTVELSWTAPASNGGAALSRYEYRRGTGTWTSTVLTRSVTAMGLTNGTLYDFSVRAVNDAGEGAVAMVSAVPRAPSTGVPGPPKDLLAAAGDSHVVLTWLAPAVTGTSSVTGYGIRHTANAPPVSPSAFTDYTGSPATIGALSNGTAYAFEVAAKNTSGYGPAAVTTATPSGDGMVTLAVSPETLSEGDAPGDALTATVTATVSTRQPAAFTVTVSAMSDDDARWEFDGTGRTLSFAASADIATGTVTLKALPNTVADGDLTVRVSGSSSSTLVTVVDAVLTIADDDMPMVSIAAPPLAATGHLFEFEAAKSYAGTLHESAVEDLEVNSAWRITRTGSIDDSLLFKVSVAESGSDFVAAAEEIEHTLEFRENEDTVLFKIVTDDEVDEAHGTVTVTLVDDTGYDVTGTVDSAVTVRDDDGPLLTFAVDPLQRAVLEGDGAAFTGVFTTVNAGLQAGTFTTAKDVGRALRARSGTFLGSARSPTGGIKSPFLRFTLLWETALTDEVTAEDFEPLSRAVFVADEFVAQAEVFRWRTEDSSVSYALANVLTLVNDDGAAGVADFDETIDDERLTVSLQRTATDDGGLGIRLRPGTRPNVAGLEVMGTEVDLDGTDFIAAVVSIAERPRLKLAVTPDLLAESPGGSVTVTATVNPTLPAPIQVTVAGSPEDERWKFASGETTLTFAAGASAATNTLTIDVTNNERQEENLVVTLTGEPDRTDVAAAEPVTLTIEDDGDLPRVSIAAPQIAQDTGHLFEHEAVSADRNAWWALTRAGPTDVALTVNVMVEEDGTDFVDAGKKSATQTVTFKVGEATTSYSPVTNDAADEMHGKVKVTVKSGTDYGVGNDEAEVDVRDDDGTLLRVSIDGEMTVAEGQPARLKVRATNMDGTLTEPEDLDRVFGASAVEVLATSADGTAMAPGDYSAIAANTPVVLQSFSPRADGGEWVYELRTRTVADGHSDGTDPNETDNETFTVSVSLPMGTDPRIVLGAPTTGTVTLREGPVVTLTLSDDDLDEGDTATVTATVDPVHDMAFMVTLAAESNADRIAFPNGTTFTFAASATTASETLTVEAVDNDIDEPDEVDVEIEATVSDTAVTAPALTLTVRDDDLPTVSIAAPTSAMDDFLYEFEAATEELQYRWSLTRAGLTDEELIVDVSVTDTGAFAAATAATVTFAAGESTAAYTPITDDDLDEEHGTVTVTVDPGTGYAVDPDAASAALAMRDDDGELVTVSLDRTTLRVIEGRKAQLYAEAETEEGTFDTAAHMTRLFGTTVTQAQATASTEASTGTGAATAGTDYTALAAETVTLPFADFAGSGGVLRSRVALPEIATTEDEVTDPDETFKVKLAAPTDQDARIAVSTTAATVTLSEGSLLRLCKEVTDEDNNVTVKCTEQDETPRLTEGRVEGQNDDGKWSTVCDDYWSNGDGNVVCKQMGYPGAERVFWSSHFGGAKRGTPTWLDNLQCVGNEEDLLDCPRRGNPAAGEHDCNPGDRHVEDAGVRCLAAESPDFGAKLDPATLTIAPGGTARYWLSLTKPLFSTEVEDKGTPQEETTYFPHSVSVKPKPDAGLNLSAPGEEAGYLGFATQGEPSTTTGGFYGWSYGQHVDVSVPARTRPGEYKVAHTMRPPLANPDFSVKLPALTVTVTAAASSGPAPVSATVSGRDASVRFDVPLDASFAPSAADFAALADGRWLAVTGAWTAGRSLLLELAEPATGAVRLAYVPSAAAPLGGRDGSPVSPFETLALAEPGDGTPDAFTMDRSPELPEANAARKLEGEPGLEAALAEALHHAPGPVAATLAAPRRAVADLSGLGALPELRRVNLAGNAVTDAGPLALLADLERLDLSGNAVRDLWPLSGLAELRVLNLSGNRVTDVTALAGLPRLRVLELSGNAVVDLSPLGALPALEYLGVAGNRVTDVTALANLHALTRLDLDGNTVFDAGPLGDAERLVWLRLSGNRLATLDGLGRLTQLRWVWVADNPLADGAAVVAWPERAWVDVTAHGP